MKMDRWDTIIQDAQAIAEMAPSGFYHAWYSSKAHEFSFCFGPPAYYRDPCGHLVAVSEVSRRKAPVSCWDDLRYVGLVHDTCEILSDDPMDDPMWHDGHYYE